MVQERDEHLVPCLADADAVCQVMRGEELPHAEDNFRRQFHCRREMDELDEKRGAEEGNECLEVGRIMVDRKTERNKSPCSSLTPPTKT